MVTPHTKKRSVKAFNANRKVPEYLTNVVRACVDSLHKSPKNDYLKAECFSKYIGSETDSADLRERRAIEKWLAVESVNRLTNQRLASHDWEFQVLPRVTLGRFVDCVRHLVKGVLGEYPPEEAVIGDFSGGASTSRKRTESDPASKCIGQAHVTGPAEYWWRRYSLHFTPGWTNPPETIKVQGNMMFTVPKTSSIDRVACKEPDINMYLQKGVGNTIRRRLKKRANIDLNDQTINQKLAHEGSVTGELATVDLSSASDSVSRELVRLCVPTAWFRLLDDLRSPTTEINGEIHVNEMFSSMGNGFTFELESLLFWALAKTTCYLTGTPGKLSVYGDDIILPAEVTPLFLYVLKYFGFTANAKKTFYTGGFRESCGGHYLNGIDISPFYVKEPLRRLTDVIRLANAIRKWSDSGTYWMLDSELETLWKYLMSFVPRRLHGGRDLGCDTQAVTPGCSRDRLTAVAGKRRHDDATYIYWLMTTHARGTATDGVQVSKIPVPSTRYRYRRVSESHHYLSHWFPGEWHADGTMPFNGWSG